VNREARLASAVIALAATAGALWLAGLTQALRYDRAAIAAGEVWRVFTGHLVHLGLGHLLLNAAGLALVALLVGRELRVRSWLAALLVCALATSAGLWWLAPEVAWYVGLSGVLHGLLVTGLARAIRNGHARALHATLLGLVVLKLGWEQYAGATAGTAWLSGGPVVVDAHLFGAAGGGLAFLLGTLAAHIRSR